MASYANYYNGGGGQPQSFQSTSGYNYDDAYKNANLSPYQQQNPRPPQPQPNVGVQYGPSQFNKTPYQAPVNPAMNQQKGVGAQPHQGGYQDLRNEGYRNDPGYLAWKKNKLFPNPRMINPATGKPYGSSGGSPYQQAGRRIDMPDQDYFDEYSQFLQQQNKPPITPGPPIGGQPYSRPFGQRTLY